MGDIIYFQASGYANDVYLCKAIVDRIPTKENPRCKATVIALNPNPLNQTHSTSLLGKRIARKTTQLLDPTNIFLASIYKEDKWISINDKQLEVINNKIQKRKK